MKRDFEAGTFTADRPASAAAVPFAGSDPAQALAAYGIELPAASVVERTVSGAPVWVVSTEPGYAAAGLWEQVRDVHPKTGLWPVLTKTDTWYRTGSEHGWQRSRELPIPQLVAETDAADWLRERYREWSGDDFEIPRGGPDWADLDLELYDYDGFDWGDVWSIRDDCDEFEQLALVPAANSWLVPYELQWSGALNHDLDGADHAMMLRRWAASERRCELVALESDTLWLAVANEPELTEDAALTQALEAYLYCADAAEQDHDSLDELAESLLRQLWRFWWD
ncbi:DUF4253 domain-containing protein [Nocardia sp. NPDC051990]|uniref:DUF4253 domain-containing protein n=1 Tax=Nocardia sp. NPDC051990 TaxID=3155285 RepID=UPI003421B309